MQACESELQNRFKNTLHAIGSFKSSPVVAVAVSGGSDSMALLLLADSWARSLGGHAIALTIDHRLRAGSAKEASDVAAWCNARGISHHTLVWSGEKPSSGKQEAARNARYALLTAWCTEHRIFDLFTAHHLEDQGETLLFRLARGSGIRGLAGIPLVSSLGGIRLIRPLLANTKQELQDYLKEKQQPWLEDPSNQSMAYTRNIIRKNLEGTNLSVRAGSLANRFGTIRNMLENNIVSYLTNLISIQPEGFVSFSFSDFQSLPKTAGMHALAMTLNHVSGDDSVRSEQIEELYGRMAQPEGFKKTSLGGCLIDHQHKTGRFLISRELAAITSAITLSANEKALWDDRFEVTFNTTTPYQDRLTVRALGKEGFEQLDRNSLPKDHKALPAYIFYSFPAFWRLEELAAVPHIEYTGPQYAQLQFFATLRQAKSLAAPAFYGMNDSMNLRQESA